MLVFEVSETGPYSLAATVFRVCEVVEVAGVPYRKESCREKKKLGEVGGSKWNWDRAASIKPMNMSDF
jgi:hypothetical protein